MTTLLTTLLLLTTDVTVDSGCRYDATKAHVTCVASDFDLLMRAYADAKKNVALTAIDVTRLQKTLDAADLELKLCRGSAVTAATPSGGCANPSETSTFRRVAPALLAAVGGVLVTTSLTVELKTVPRAVLGGVGLLTLGGAITVAVW